jgi:antitoxin component YwqK of YwqJK toxin-antitoxin module
MVDVRRTREIFGFDYCRLKQNDFKAQTINKINSMKINKLIILTLLTVAAGSCVQTKQHYRPNKPPKSVNGDKKWCNGETIRYYSDGVTVQERAMFKNCFVRQRITYFTDGNVEWERNFDENGKPHGAEKKYQWETGMLKTHLNYEHGIQTGLQVRYVASNAGDFIETYYCNEKGQIDGDYSETFAIDNTMKVRGQYANGKKYGIWIFGSQTDGVYDGIYKTEIYNNGILMETKNF